jgi:hypothetical protein
MTVMRSLTVGLIALAICGLDAAPASAQKGKFRDDAERYGWTEDLPAALKEAKRTNKPVIVILRCIP